MGPLFLGLIFIAAGLTIRTRWADPGPRFVRNRWIVPATLAMAVLTLIGIAFPGDYSAAFLFFMPQLAIASHAARSRTFEAVGPDSR
jgi:hypothetical protein